MKLDLLLQETGYKPSNPNNPPRVGVYLTNSLEEHHPDADTLFASWLSKEANDASRIKRDMPIMVAFGNPPYNVRSSNKGDYIENLMEEYKKNIPRNNIGPLSNDYIKFIRLGEHNIEKTGYGVLAYITSNSFYDGIIHKQMRKHLLETFDHIYAYNLHGNSNKGETCPDGSKDENVFDIMEGVAITILIKDGSTNKNFANLYYKDSYGIRDKKYSELINTNIHDNFIKLDPQIPTLFFIDRDVSNKEYTDKFFAVDDLFTEKGVGTKFRKDNLLIKPHFDPQSVTTMVNDMQNEAVENIKKKYSIDETKDWKIEEQRQYFSDDKKDIRRTLYRPFDNRFTYYPYNHINKIIPRGDSRRGVMRHMFSGENLMLITPRQVAEEAGAFVSNNLAGHKIFSAYNLNYCFPLYFYLKTI